MRSARRGWRLLWAVLLVLCATAMAEVAEDLCGSVELQIVPDFSGAEDGEPTIVYGARDALGRATAAFARLGPELLSDAQREDMSRLQPTGLHNAPYAFIRDGWVYNRCHLIGHQFSGASELDNLITGTHALNHAYMLPWENRVADYIRRTGGHVLYRVTPVYEGDDLVCGAVLLEALACDGGLCFCVMCPNVQPGVAIDYATGYTTLADDWQAGGTTTGERTYVINPRTQRFHLPGCAEAQGISKRRREERVCNRAELLAEGMKPCGVCRP